MVEQRVAAVLGRSRDARVAARGPSARPYGPSMPAAQQRLDRPRDVARVAVAVVAERDRGRAVEASATPVMPRRSPAVEHGAVLGDRDLAGGRVEGVEVDVLGAAVARRAAPRARPRTARAARRAAARAAAPPRRRRPARRRAPRSRPRFVAECSQPSGPAKSTSLRAASAGVEALARLVVDQLPAGLGDRRVLAQQMAHRRAPLRLPIPSDSLPAQRLAARRRALDAPSSASSPCSTMSPVLEQDALARSRATAACGAAGTRGPCEVLELLALGVAHDRRAPRGRPRRRAAARTSRSPRPPRSATRTGGRTSASPAAARRAARGTGRIPSILPGRRVRRDLPTLGARSPVRANVSPARVPVVTLPSTLPPRHPASRRRSTRGRRTAGLRSMTSSPSNGRPAARSLCLTGSRCSRAEEPAKTPGPTCSWVGSPGPQAYPAGRGPGARPDGGC